MNLGLLGAIGGLGQGMQTVGAGMVKTQEDIDKEQRSLIMAKTLQQDRFDLEDARAKRLSGEVTTEANRIAGERASGLLGASKNVQGPMPDGSPLAESQGNIDAFAGEAAKQAVPTLRDRVQAKANLGQGGEMDLLKLDTEERKDKTAAENVALANRKLGLAELQAAAREALGNRRLDLDAKRLEAMISGIGAWAKSSGAGKEKTTSMMADWAFLVEKGWTDEKIAQKLLDGKDVGYETVATKGYDAAGNEVTTTKKVSAAASAAASKPPVTGRSLVWDAKTGKMLPK